MSNMGLDFFIALRYLQARHRERFISIITIFSFLGIFLGVATLVIVMSVMNGFKQELLDRILGYSGHVTITAGAGGALGQAPALASTLRGRDAGIQATPYIRGQALLSSPSATSGVQVLAMAPAVLADRFGAHSPDTAGAPAGDVVYLGTGLARASGLVRGDRVTLLSPRGPATAFGTFPQSRPFRIAGTIDFGMHAYDHGVVLMDIDTARAFFALKGGAASGIELVLDDPMQASQYAGALRADFGDRYYITDWRTDNLALVGALDVERNVMFLILTLIILVAAFNIISGQLMLVREKERAIAILQTLGATQTRILRIFLISGAIIGVAGTVCGVAGGVVFSHNIDRIKGALEALLGQQLFPSQIYYLSQLPAQIVPMEVVQIALLALGLVLASAMYPALRASRVLPARVLRNE